MIARRLVLAPLVALSLVAASCSGDDGGGSSVDPNLPPQQQIAEEFIDRMDDDASDLIDTDCIRDLFALLDDDDAELVLGHLRADAEQVPDDVDPELRELLDTISFRLFDCVVFDEGDFEFEGDLDDFDGELDVIEIGPDGEIEGALEG